MSLLLRGGVIRFLVTMPRPLIARELVSSPRSGAQVRRLDSVEDHEGLRWCVGADTSGSRYVLFASRTA